MKSRAAALGLIMMLGWPAAAARAQVISRPPDLRLEDVVDSLTGPGGRIIMGDVEYSIGRDPGAKGGVGVIRHRHVVRDLLAAAVAPPGPVVA